MALKPPLLEKTITEYDLNVLKARERHRMCQFALFLDLHYFTEELGLAAPSKKKKGGGEGNLDCKKYILLLSKDTEIVRSFRCLWNWHNALQLNGFAKWLCKKTFPPLLAWKLLLFLLTLLTSVWVHVFQLTSNFGECQKVTSVPWVTINLKIKRWSLKSSLSITKP